MNDVFSERATTVVAGGAATSPWWLPYLEQVSSTMSLWLPIVGMGWLLIQICGYLYPIVKPIVKKWLK